MQHLVYFLALLGGLALAYRLLRALARFTLTYAEVTASAGMAEISARRGDLTLLAERRANERDSRRRRRADAGLALLWLLWLLLPPIISWAAPSYAAAAVLWLLPDRPIRSPPAHEAGADTRPG